MRYHGELHILRFLGPDHSHISEYTVVFQETLSNGVAGGKSMWELRGDGELRAFLGAARVGMQSIAEAISALGAGGSANIGGMDLSHQDLEILDLF